MTTNQLIDLGNKKIISIEEYPSNFPKEVEYHSAPKRPTVLKCDIHRTKIKNEEWILLVGLLNDKPYEVFGGLAEAVEIPKKFSAGKIYKRFVKNTGKYDLVVGEGDDELKVKDVIRIFDNPNYGTLTRFISLSMRHGVEIRFIVDQLQKDDDSDFFSFTKMVSRILKKYIKDGTVVKSKCPSCESEDMAYTEGCLNCLSCGYSKCS